MKPPDPLTAATSTALMTGALDRLRAKHAQYRPMTDDEDDANKTGHRPMTIVRDGAPTPPPIPRPAPPLEVEIPDWLQKASGLSIAEQAWRTQGRIALAHGRVTLAELEAERSPPAVSLSPSAQGAGVPAEVTDAHARADAPAGPTGEGDHVGRHGAGPNQEAPVVAAGRTGAPAAPVPAARFCLHCPGRGAHKMSCSAYKSGYVRADEPCALSLRELSDRADERDRGGGRSTWHTAIEVEPTPPAPPTDGDPLAEGSAWLQGAGLLAQLQPGAAQLNPSSGAGAALQRALERDGDLVLRRLRYALSEPSEGALRESIAAGDVSLGALVPARPSATTRRLDDGAARPVLRVIAGGRR